MTCNFVEIYDSPDGGTPLSQNDLVIGQKIYLILTPETGYSFKEWVDRYGKQIPDDIIISVEGYDNVYETTFQCNYITAVFLSEVQNTQNENHGWIKIYDSQIGGNELDPSDVQLDQSNRRRVYVDISEMPKTLNFVKWLKYDDDNDEWVDMSNTEIMLLKGGRYVTMFQCGMKIAAYVTEKIEQTCSLTLSVYPTGSGTVTITPNSGYSCGDTVQITATPNSCYKFLYWDDGAEDSGEQTRNITIGGVNMLYTAHFELEEYNINAISNNRIEGLAEGPSSTVKCGDIFQIKATPNGGYEFDHWDDGNTNAIRQITFAYNTQTTYIAYFRNSEKYYVIYNKNFAQSRSSDDEVKQGPFLPNKEYSLYYITLPTEFYREGYSFLGWSSRQDSDEPEFMPGEKTETVFDDSVVLYAVWEEKNSSQLIYYDAEGNSLSSIISPETYYDGDIVTLAQGSDFNLNPSLFLGWQITDNVDPVPDVDRNSIPAYMGKIVFDYEKCYAHAKMAKEGENYVSVTYDFNLSKPCDGNSGIVTQVCGIINGSTVDIMDPQAFGVDYSECLYNFKGWSMMKPQSGFVVEVPKRMAFFTDSYFVAIVEEMEKVSLTFHNTCEKNAYIKIENVFKEDNFYFDCEQEDICEGYTLIGWSTEKEADFPEYECGTFMYVNEDVVLYSVLVRNTFYMTYHYCNGIIQEIENEIGENVEIEDYGNCEHDGCQATGWLDLYTTSSYNAGVTVSGLTQDMDLYLEYGDCCPVTFYSTNMAGIKVNNNLIDSNGGVINIQDGDTIEIVTSEYGGTELGWFDMTNKKYVTLCDNPIRYEYIFVPEDTGINNYKSEIYPLSNTFFLEAIQEPNTCEYEFIRNQSTGEIRQKVGICGDGDVSYDFECGHTMMAVVVSKNYTQTTGGDDYVLYDPTSYNTIYEYIASNNNTIYNRVNIIIILNNTRYYYTVS